MSQPAPTYAAMRANYPAKADGMDKDRLFKLIGWEALIEDIDYHNTCATRMSIALLGAGFSFPGRMRINAGPLKGRRVEPGQARLSTILAQPQYLGPPEKFKMAQATEVGIGRRMGIVSFFQLDATDPTNRQGHMDLVAPENGGPKVPRDVLPDCTRNLVLATNVTSLPPSPLATAVARTLVQQQ